MNNTQPTHVKSTRRVKRRQEKIECSLERVMSGEAGHFNPKNAAAALSFQLHDDVKVLHSLAQTGNEETVKRGLHSIKTKIAVFEKHGMKRALYPTEVKR